MNAGTVSLVKDFRAIRTDRSQSPRTRLAAHRAVTGSKRNDRTAFTSELARVEFFGAAGRNLAHYCGMSWEPFGAGLCGGTALYASIYRAYDPN